MHSSFVRNTPTTNNLILRSGIALVLGLSLGACSHGLPSPTPAVPASLAEAAITCTSCHAAGAPTLATHMDSASPMMRALSDFDPARSDGLSACRSCHGGSALPTSTATAAHHQNPNLYGLLGQFTANPTTNAVVDQVCGVCHRGHVDQIRVSAMNVRPGANLACASACHVMDSTHGGQSGCSVCHNPRLPTVQGADVFDHHMMGSGKRPRARQELYPDEPTVGVPEAGCIQCHSGGYQVALRYLGTAMPRRAVRGYRVGPAMYRADQADVHRTRGLQCQDCHTSFDIHGPEKVIIPDNAVEIECADCHGTAEQRPWDLPLGYMDAPSDATAPRGTARTVLALQLHGRPAPRIDDFMGYLRSARGTPLKNVIRVGDLALLYDTQNIPHVIPPLSVRTGHDSHTLAQKECYACHSHSRVEAPSDPLAMNRDGLLAPVLRSIRYADGTHLPPAAYTPHDVLRSGMP